MNSHAASRARVATARLRSLYKIATVPCSLWMLALGLESTALPAHAQQPAAQAQAALSGRVLNSTNGLYIKNAHIAVEGTGLQAVTDEFGEYRIYGVPAGELTVQVTYPGLDSKTEKFSVNAGESLERNFTLVRGGVDAEKGEAIVLDAFIVSTQKETNAQAIATNEQRYAANLKNVVAADSFGDIAEGNVGEFLKYLPGVQADYNATEVRGISLNGFDPLFTGVSVDGARSASPSSANSARQFDVRAVSLNNISRAEVIKVPLADMPADNLGGSVNLITKSAFENTKAQFNYSTYLSLNSENPDFWKRTYGLPNGKRTFTSMPGATFNYIKPVNRRLGFTINGLFTNQFNENHRPIGTWRLNGGGATTAAPYLQTYQNQDGPSDVHRASLSAKVDWKIAPTSVLSVSVASTLYKFSFGNRNITYTVGGTTTSAVTGGGVNLSFSPDFTQGATGRGDVSYGGSMRNFEAVTNLLVLNYRFTGRDWQATAGGSYSMSKSFYRDTRDGYFQAFGANMTYAAGTGSPARPVTVRISNNLNLPAQPTVLVGDNTGAAVDHNNLANYRLNTVQSSPADGEVIFKSAFADLSRALPIKNAPTTVKMGAAIRDERRDNRRQTLTWNYLGPDLLTNTADNSLSRFADTTYTAPAGFGTYVTWADPRKMYALYKERPEYFAPQAGATEQNRIRGSELTKETVTAGYVRVDSKLFDRLLLVGGVRYEKTEDTGEAYAADPDAPFRDAAGKIVRNAAGAKVRQPTAPAAGTFEEARLINRERANELTRDYDGYYPSFGATYSITTNLQFRAFFAKTIGRPDISTILPNLTIDEADTLGGSGDANTNLITINNPALLPWTGQGIDLSLEYYFPKGGVVSLRAFQKKLSNFWTVERGLVTPAIAEELGVGPQYGDGNWQYSTRGNGGGAKITGLELAFNRRLTFLPGQFKNLSFLSNGTANHLEGANNADFTKFIRRSGNLGLGWNKARVRADVKLNYRGRQRNANAFGTAPGAYNYEASRYSLDFNISYKLTKNTDVYFNARNLTNRPQVTEVYNQDVPFYARRRNTQEFGIPMYIGLKGSY